MAGVLLVQEEVQVGLELLLVHLEETHLQSQNYLYHLVQIIL
jgi:hypothetical protein